MTVSNKFRISFLWIVSLEFTVYHNIFFETNVRSTPQHGEAVTGGVLFGVLKIFENFPGKHLRWSLFIIKLQA